MDNPGLSRDTSGQVPRTTRGAALGTTGTTLVIPGVPLSRCPGPATSPTGLQPVDVKEGRDFPTLKAPSGMANGGKVHRTSAPGDSFETLSIPSESASTVPSLSHAFRTAAPSGDVGRVTAEPVEAPVNSLTVRPDGLAVTTAADAIGPLRPGCSVFTLGAGAFGPVDVLTHCLDATGPASVTLATWTAGRSDIFRTAALLRDGRITSLRMVTDASLPQRHPAYFAALVERYGPASVCLSKLHAKFVVVRNADWSLVLLTSSNLDGIRRLEFFHLSDDAGLASHLEAVVDRLFAAPEVSLDAVLASYRPARRFYGDGALDADLRRAGWSYRATGAGL